MQVDNTMPESKWEFDESVANVFEDMLQRSIPQYDVMRKSVTDLAIQYLPRGGVLVDLGCSRGEALRNVHAERPDCHYIGIEISSPMIQGANKDVPFAEIIPMDLRRSYPSQAADVTLSVLTIQFIPMEYRQRIFWDIYNHTNVLIIVEKVIGATAQIDSDFVRNYYNLKGINGYTHEQIERKRLSLEGALVPVTAKWNEELLRTAGFNQVDCFWRWMNFAGWIAIKNERHKP